MSDRDQLLARSVSGVSRGRNARQGLGGHQPEPHQFLGIDALAACSARNASMSKTPSIASARISRSRSGGTESSSNTSSPNWSTKLLPPARLRLGLHLRHEVQFADLIRVQGHLDGGNPPDVKFVAHLPGEPLAQVLPFGVEVGQEQYHQPVLAGSPKPLGHLTPGVDRAAPPTDGER